MAIKSAEAKTSTHLSINHRIGHSTPMNELDGAKYVPTNEGQCYIEHKVSKILSRGHSSQKVGGSAPVYQHTIGIQLKIRIDLL